MDYSSIEQNINDENPTDQTTDQTTTDQNGAVQDNWSKFAKYVLFSFILSIFIGIIGSNFIFLTHLSQSELEKWVPTISQDENGGGFYKTARGGAGAAGAGASTGASRAGASRAGASKAGASRAGASRAGAMRGGASSCSVNNNEGFQFSGLSANWPYSMYKKELLPGFTQSFKNWIAETTAASFMKYRTVIKTWLSLVSDVNNIIQMTILAPFTFLCFPFIYFYSFWASLYEAFFTNVFWAIVGCVLLFVWPFVGIVSFLELINFLMLFTISPIYSNSNVIKDIFNCNLNSITLIFGFLICLSSFLTLDLTTSIIASVIYIAMSAFTLL